ncbi:MAG: DNA methyltransferase [Armatimonadota bacterium]
MLPRRASPNRLNDLSNREWLKRTKSFWLSEARRPLDPLSVHRVRDFMRATVGDEGAEMLLGQIMESFVYSQPPARDELKSEHPATFAEEDVQRLIELFTKRGERVLDPFLGTGSTLIACHRTGRCGTGIELTAKWVEIARQRLQREVSQPDLFDGAGGVEQEIIQGDAREEIAGFADDSFDFVVTSPPYWSILRKDGMKTAAEREARGLDTRYSDADRDLGNIERYDEFLAELDKVWRHCARVVKPGRYACVIVCDFRHGRDFYLYHADIAERVKQAGLRPQGITILAQDSKTLYPYGIPNVFVSNIHHQYVLIFRKDVDGTSGGGMADASRRSGSSK